jgi:thioredoxin reductase (NADPH)
VGGSELGDLFQKQAERFGARVEFDSAYKVDLSQRPFRVEADSGIYLADTLIIATGASPNHLNVPGEIELTGKGVSYCATCDGFFFRNRTVMVVGGGDTAAEEALYLAKITNKVYLAHRRDALRASRILQERIQRECKIEMLWNTVVETIQADDSGVNGAQIKNLKTGETRTIDVEGVFIFVGFDPNNNLVPAGVKLNAEGYVVTNEKCETSIPGIYAVGDLREKYARQVVLSAADGCTAALASAHYVEAKKAAEACALPGA